MYEAESFKSVKSHGECRGQISRIGFCVDFGKHIHGCTVSFRILGPCVLGIGFLDRSWQASS